MRRFFTLLLIGVAAGALSNCASVEDAVLAPLKYANGKPVPIAASQPVDTRQKVQKPKRKRVYRQQAPVYQPVQTAPKPVQTAPKLERPGGGEGPGGGGWG